MKNIFNSTAHTIVFPNIIKASGIHVIDSKGKKYLDLESGVWCASVGHNNPLINQAIREQLDRVSHTGFCYSSAIVDQAAAELLTIAGISGKVVFLSSGSEAVEYARRLSKHCDPEGVTVALHDAYLGAYETTINKNNNWFLFNWEACRQCEQPCDISCEKLLALPAKISEFIFEPGSSGGFVRFPPQKLISNIIKLVRQAGGRILINEVTTGMGRTGRWFGYNHYAISPDIVALGKGLGNGYPVSAIVIGNKVLEAAGDKFMYAQSHQNDPLGARVALEVIRFIRQNQLLELASSTGDYLIKQMRSLIDSNTVTAVRGRGLMLAIDLADIDIGNRLYTYLHEKGIIVSNRRGYFRIDPPLTITRKEIDEFIEKFRAGLKKINLNHS